MLVQIINIPDNLGQFVLLSFLSACLEMSFQEYLQPSMIFEKYGYFLNFLYDKPGIRRKLSQLLGLCVFCNGFWVAVGIYEVYYKDFSLTILLFTGINYVFIKILSITFNKLLK